MHFYERVVFNKLRDKGLHCVPVSNVNSCIRNNLHKAWSWCLLEK